MSRRLLLLACLCVSVSALALAPGSALAARGHKFVFSFASQGSSEGQLEDPAGIAVNEATGDVYVADKGNSRVEAFSGEGKYLRQFNGSGALSGEGEAAGHGALKEAGHTYSEIETGRFDEPTQIAVDNTCYREKLTGTACEKADPSNEDVYVVDLGSGHDVIDKYTAAGRYVGQITQSEKGGRFESPEAAIGGVAVGPDGTVYVTALDHGKVVEKRVYFYDDAVHNSMCSTCEVSEFNPSGFGGVTGLLGEGLAVDSAGDIYVRYHEFTSVGKIPEYAPSGSELLRVLEGEFWGLAMEVSSGDVYVGSGEGVERFGPSGDEAIERIGLVGLTGGGLAVNGSSGESSSDDVYATSSGTGVVDVFPLEPPGPPTVDNSGVAEVSANGARALAEINPRGAATTYRVEYGKCSSMSVNSCVGSGFEGAVPVSGAFVGAGFESERVSVVLGGLVSHVTYHFRVVASNETKGQENVVEGEEVVFTTQSTGGGLVLPDGRAWELVSPADKHGALIEPIKEGGIAQAAFGGDAFTFLASNPTEVSPAGYTNEVQVLAHRATGGGWSSEDIATPHEAPTGQTIGEGQEYRFFSEDLSQGVVQPFGPFDPLSPGASEQTAYLRTNFGGSGSGFCTESCYRPLVTGCPEAGEPCAKPVEALADVTPGTVFGLSGEACVGICGPEARAASHDLSAIVIESKVGLLEGDPAGLYEWVAGKLYSVSPGVGSGSQAFVWVDDGGSRVVAGDVSGGVPLRLVDPLTGEETQLDAGSGCAGCESGGAEFPWVAGEGSRVFFRDKRALVEGADSGKEGVADLYVCEVPAGKPGCVLSDLTPKPVGGHADVLGIVGASADGSSVYFAANGKLTSEAVNGNCPEIGRSGECNLYVVRREGSGWSAPRLVAVLSGEDRSDWQANLSHHPAVVAGEWLAFMSERSLTGYDNRDASDSTKLDEEVYLYHASDGTLVCVSCNPTGERPHGVEYQKMGSLASGGGNPLFSAQQWVAANVPGWTPFALEQSDYESRFVSGSGRVFFDSSDALAPQDVNGTEDVYEYEPPGVGSCTTESATYSERSQGCVGLISSGESPTESAFLDASTNGSDVFFLTSQALSSEDHDTALDVYDAHECSSSAPCPSAAPVPEPECETESSCRPAPTPQPSIFGAPASALFSGPGNPAPTTQSSATGAKTVVKQKPQTRVQKLEGALKACRRDRTKARQKQCERSARARYGAVDKAKGKGGK